MDWTGEKENFHKFRSKGLGSSDMPVIMGVSPWKKPHGLWLEKTGIKPSTFKGNAATERGNELEPMVRSWYNENHGRCMIPESKVSDKYDYFRCNVDGVDHSINKVIEIKCGNLEDHIRAHSEGKIPDKYYPQVMFFAYMYGYSVDYVSYNDKLKEAPFVVIKAEVDEEYINGMISMAHKFWEMVQTRTPPVLDDSEDSFSSNAEMTSLIATYNGLKESHETAGKEMKEIQNKLSALVTHKKTVCNGYRMTWIERKGSVNYAKIPDLKKVDVEQYRNKPSKFFTLRRIENDK